MVFGVMALTRITLGCDAIAGQTYSDPPEVPALELDASSWQVAQRTRELAAAQKQYVRPGETLRSFSESITWRVTFRSMPKALAATRDALLTELRRQCAGVQTRELAAGATDLIFEWSHEGCHGQNAQHEVVRLIAGRIGTHQISYARLGSKIPEQAKQEWASRLRRIALVSDFADAEVSEVDRARMFYWTGRDEAAIELLTPLAESGNVDAQEELAGLYYQRWDLNRALRWFRRAAEQDHPEALFHLGRLYENGWGLESADLAKALELYHAAARKGHTEAQLRLGVLAESASPSDRETATRWFERAAKSGEIDAMFELGRLLEGEGDREESLSEAVRWYRLAAEAGSADAQFALGRLHADGHGVPRDDARAVTWLIRAAMQGQEQARAFYLERYRERAS